MKATKFMEIKYIHQLGELFETVQMQAILPDGKTFPDCIPKYELDVIHEKYFNEKNSPDFNLKNFVDENFDLPKEPFNNYETDLSKPVETHIEKLWDVLTRKPGGEVGSLIPLPYPYIVPGGRFREIYYWDSYFTMLGLKSSKRFDLIENMVDNFAYLIDYIGYIPNGNRSYYIGRSQPPFFSLMVKLLAEINGENILVKYLSQLEQEYFFWMKGSDELSNDNNAANRVAKVPDGSIMNRYWDDNDTPRPESYREDVELAHHASNKNILYRHIRAAAESGWDFSSRWFKDAHSFSTIHTTEIIPVDLNCLLFHLEEILAEAYSLLNNFQQAAVYTSLGAKRKEAIEKYCWNEKAGFYLDYDFAAGAQTTHYTLAAAFPLFFSLASTEQAQKVASVLYEKFLSAGGLATTLETTGQQWDAPNGWAPLQWLAIKGLQNYSLNQLANEIAKRWTSLNIKVFKRTGKLMEKYNVLDTNLDAGGGEYPSQDGFGWTNGVLLKLLSENEFK